MGGPNKFSDTFTCHKGSPTGKLYSVPNHGSWDTAMPGKMVESLGPVSPPYWVLKTYGGEADGASYDGSLVYACVGALGIKAEYLYFMWRHPTLPAAVESDMRAHLRNHSITDKYVKNVPMDGC